jgi:hypothetical protein
VAHRQKGELLMSDSVPPLPSAASGAESESSAPPLPAAEIRRPAPAAAEPSNRGEDGKAADGEHRFLSENQRKLALWILGAIAASIIGWAITVFLTNATAAPSLSVSGPSTDDGTDLVAITFTATNSGSATAADCTAYLQLPNGKISMNTEPLPVVPAGSSQTFKVLYFKERAEGSLRFTGFVWAECQGTASPKLQVYAPTAVALGAYLPTILNGTSLTTIGFHVRNTGDETAGSCQAFLRFGTGATIVKGIEPTVPSNGYSAFTISFNPAGSPGGAVKVWATCRINNQQESDTPQQIYRTEEISVTP